MIVDSSAIIAILFGEPDAAFYANAIATASAAPQGVRISAVTYVKAAVVVESQISAAGAQQFDAFMRRAGIVVEAVTEQHALLARQAYADFGKGRHPAGLNFGDCFSYALARASGEPLLFKGNDFSKTCRHWGQVLIFASKRQDLTPPDSGVPTGRGAPPGIWTQPEPPGWMWVGTNPLGALVPLRSAGRPVE